MGNASNKKNNRVFMGGIDCAGKTTILYKLKLPHSNLPVMPTCGFNVEVVTIGHISLQIWEVGGGCKIRQLWKHYLGEGLTGLIYVIDMSDP